MASALMTDGVRGVVGICRARFTLLGTDCSVPTTGDKVFVTDALMNLTLARQYRTIPEAEKVSCRGGTVLWHIPESKTLKQIDLTGTIGVYNPEFMALVFGHTTFLGDTTTLATSDLDTAMGTKIIGTAETPLKTTEVPKVSIEIWQETVGPGLNGVCSSVAGLGGMYLRHVFPMVQLYMADSQELGTDGGVEFGITGTAVANPQFDKGVAGTPWPATLGMPDTSPYGSFVDQPTGIPAATAGVITLA